MVLQRPCPTTSSTDSRVRSQSQVVPAQVGDVVRGVGEVGRVTALPPAVPRRRRRSCRTARWPAATRSARWQGEVHRVVGPQRHPDRDHLAGPPHLVGDPGTTTSDSHAGVVAVPAARAPRSGSTRPTTTRRRASRRSRACTRPASTRCRTASTMPLFSESQAQPASEGNTQHRPAPVAVRDDRRGRRRAPAPAARRCARAPPASSCRAAHAAPPDRAVRMRVERVAPRGVVVQVRHLAQGHLVPGPAQRGGHRRGCWPAFSSSARRSGRSAAGARRAACRARHSGRPA